MIENVLKKYLMLAIMGLAAISFSSDGFAQQQQAVETSEQIKARSAYIDGLAAFENEEYKRALDLLTTAYVKLPDHPGVNFALADAYLQINDIGNAEYYGKQAIKLDPENLWYRLKLVEVYRLSGKTEAAVNELNKGLEYHPGDENLLQQLAQLYNESGSLQKANKIYDKLLQLKGESINVRLQKLQNFNQLNMQDSVIVELEKIRDLNPGNLSTLQVLSNHYLEMDRLKEARQVLQNALQINQTDPKTLIMLADIYMEEAKWDSVGATLGSVVSDSAASFQTKHKIARYLNSKYHEDQDNENLRQATTTVFEKIIESEPESAEILTLSAEFFTNTQQYDLALRALERTTRLNPTNDKAWQRRLQLLMRDGKTKEAITVGKEAAEQIPQDPIILHLLGSAYLSNQHYQQAVEKLEEATSLPARTPLKISIYSSLGDAYAGLEKWDQSFENYEESIALDPKNAEVLNKYAYYLAHQQQNLSKAEEIAQRALEIEPENPSYLDTMGWIYYQQEEFEQAKQYIQKAIDTGSAGAEVLEHMGDVLHKLDKPQEANIWWQKALDKDSTRTHLKNKLKN